LTGPKIVSVKESKSGREARAPFLPLIEAIKKKYASENMDVKLIGNGELSLTQQELDQFFEVLSDTSEPLTVILNAHGTPHLSPTSSYDRHLMTLKEGAPIASLDFFKKIAAVRQDKPIDIFSCSCFGGLMQPFVKHILPTGSVYVSLNSDPSKVSFITALLEWMGADNASFPTCAEELLLILSTKMSHSRYGMHYFQDVSISSSGFSLNLQDNVVAHLNVQFSSVEMERINKQMGCFVEKETLEKIKGKIEKSPVIIDFRSQSHFNEYEYGLALAICYAAKRDLSKRQPVVFMFERKRRCSDEPTTDQILPSALNVDHKRKKIN